MKKITLVAPKLTEPQIEALKTVDAGGDIKLYNSIIVDSLFRRGLIRRKQWGGVELTKQGKGMIA